MYFHARTIIKYSYKQQLRIRSVALIMEMKPLIAIQNIALIENILNSFLFPLHKLSSPSIIATVTVTHPTIQCRKNIPYEPIPLQQIHWAIQGHNWCRLSIQASEYIHAPKHIAASHTHNLGYSRPRTIPITRQSILSWE